MTALFDEICAGAERESRLWAESLLPADERELALVFSPLVPDPAQALGLETIYEGYLLHYGRSRLFASTDADIALLLGDTLLAHGLVRITDLGEVRAVGDLAELLSLCAQLRADGRDGDGIAWAASAAYLGRGGLEAARRALREGGDASKLAAAARARGGDAAVSAALSAHAALVAPPVGVDHVE
ncbi:MAG: hypothetical protein U0R50_15025 [Gaiellales bacterium]